MTKSSLRNLDLNLMVVFEAIYATGSTSAAAGHLNMSQPAVSNALARLRKLMDDPLFTRVPRGMLPTQKARRIVGPVRAALKLLGEQVSAGEIELATHERDFKIIIADTLEALMIPGVVNAMMVQMPNATLECMSGFRTDFVGELVAGSIDLACYVFPPTTPDIVTEPIAANDPVLVARRGHPAFKRPLTPENYARLKHIVLAPDLRSKIEIEQSLRANGVRRKPTYVVSKLWSFPPMIESTDLIGILPRYFARHVRKNFAIEFRELPIESPHVSTYMTWHVRNNDDPGHRWLREALMTAFHAATADDIRCETRVSR